MHLCATPATFPWTHTLEPRPAWAAPLDTLPVGRRLCQVWAPSTAPQTNPRLIRRL